MHFYIPDLKANILNESEAAHLFVMRVQENKIYKATDLNGRVCKILITKVDKKTKTIEFEQAEIPKTAKFRSKVMFQAIPDKVYLDKLCEVLPLTCVTDLFLFYSDNSIQYPINKERISKLLIRSCEQAQVAYLPKIVVLNKQDLDIELKKHKPIVLDCNLLAHKINNVTAISMSTQKEEALADSQSLYRNDTINDTMETETPRFQPNYQPAIIGPEGGWSTSEIQHFQSLELTFASLGAIVYPAWIAGLVWESRSQFDKSALKNND